MAEHELGYRHGATRIQVPAGRIEEVVLEVAHERKVDPAQIRSDRRFKRLVLARREVWRRLAKPDVSIVSIAKAWPCDHTTILHGLNRVNRNKRRYEECNSSVSPA